MLRTGHPHFLEFKAGTLAGGIRKDFRIEVAWHRRQYPEHGLGGAEIVGSHYVEQPTHEPTVPLYTTIVVEVELRVIASIQAELVPTTTPSKRYPIERAARLLLENSAVEVSSAFR